MAGAWHAKFSTLRYPVEWVKSKFWREVASSSRLWAAFVITSAAQSGSSLIQHLREGSLSLLFSPRLPAMGVDFETSVSILADGFTALCDEYKTLAAQRQSLERHLAQSTQEVRKTPFSVPHAHCAPQTSKDEPSELALDLQLRLSRKLSTIHSDFFCFRHLFEPHTSMSPTMSG